MRMIVTQTLAFVGVRVRRQHEGSGHPAQLAQLPVPATWRSALSFFITNAPLPTSPAGLEVGNFWNNGGVICVIGAPSWLPTTDLGLSVPAFWNDGGVLTLNGSFPGIQNTTNPSGFPSGAIYSNGGVLCVV